MLKTGLNIKAESLVPHRDKMSLLTILNEYSPDHARGTALFSEDDLFINQDGYILGAAYIEMLAQLTAAYRGYESTHGGKAPKIGYLVGIKDFEIIKPLMFGVELDLYAERTFQLDHVTIIDGEVSCNGETVGKGSIRVWEIEDTPGNPLDFKAETSSYKVNDSNFSSSLPAAARGVLRNSILKYLIDLKPGDSNDEFVASFSFDNDFVGFNGHFPGFPVLSGVLMIEIGLVLCEENSANPVWLTQVKKAKYSGLVVPGDEIEVFIKIKRENDLETNADMKLLKAGKPVASVSFSYKNKL